MTCALVKISGKGTNSKYRGTGNTFKFSCYATEEERQLAALTPAIGFGNASDVMLGRIWAASTVGADACFTNTESKERGSMINTPFSARDMMQIVDAVEEDGLLRYWGEKGLHN